jgi:hypothetical protein
MRRFSQYALLMITLFILSYTTPATAHNPIFAGENHDYSNAVLIPDPNVSYALYGYLDTPRDVHYYYFDVKGPIRLMTQLNVPKADAYAAFRPSYAIIGPGIHTNDNLPFTLPKNNGSLLVNASMQYPRSEFYEPFSGITYNLSAKKYTNITVPGRYYIAVFDDTYKKGDNVLTVGEIESFSLWDMPATLWRVIELRLGWLDHSKAV